MRPLILERETMLSQIQSTAKRFVSSFTRAPVTPAQKAGAAGAAVGIIYTMFEASSLSKASLSSLSLMAPDAFGLLSNVYPTPNHTLTNIFAAGLVSSWAAFQCMDTDQFPGAAWCLWKMGIAVIAYKMGTVGAMRVYNLAAR